MRLSSPQLQEKVVTTLKSLGAEVIDIGLSSTPTLYFSVRKNSFDTGIEVSASHNPKEYNGLKIVKRTDNGLMKIGKTTGMEEIKKIVVENDFVDYKAGGSVKKIEGVVEEEVEEAISSVKPLTLKSLHVVADTANAMGVLYLEALFKKVPGNLTIINRELDGTFPAHQPDPLQFETLKELQAKVKEVEGDLGIAPDGDADRTFFIDEKGQIVPASLITTLLIRELLNKYPGETVACDIRYIINARNLVKKMGGKLVISKVGHALITESMHQSNALFAGESSGHYFFRQTGFAESSVTAVLIILNILSREGKPFSEVLKEVQTSHESGEYNFELEDASMAKPVLEKLTEIYKDGEISTLDGIAIEFGSWRFSVRTSNTEPLMRLNVEAEDESVMQNKKNELIEKILSLGGVPEK